MTGVLILVAATVVYALICLARPHHTCSRCHGTRITRNSAGRRSRCRACRGTGIKARPGARLVHGFYQHVKGEPDRAGRMDRINRGQAEAEHERKLRLDDLRDRVAAAGYSAGHAEGYEAGPASVRDDSERLER
jgi:hypothetical protein